MKNINQNSASLSGLILASLAVLISSSVLQAGISVKVWPESDRKFVSEMLPKLRPGEPFKIEKSTTEDLTKSDSRVEYYGAGYGSSRLSFSATLSPMLNIEKLKALVCSDPAVAIEVERPLPTPLDSPRKTTETVNCTVRADIEKIAAESQDLNWLSDKKLPEDPFKDQRIPKIKGKSNVIPTGSSPGVGGGVGIGDNSEDDDLNWYIDAHQESVSDVNRNRKGKAIDKITGTTGKD